MPGNGSSANCCEAGGRAWRPGWPASPRPPWVAPALFAVLGFTTVVDALGSLLVILSVLRNRKLRSYAGERRARLRAHAVPRAWPRRPPPSLLSAGLPLHF